MCGIVGAVAGRKVSKILLEGLKRLEYRGYDSAGIAIIDNGELKTCKREGKVEVLEEAVLKEKYQGTTGIAHTRWATHGKPCEENAHPHVSDNEIALVHNGIIENHEELKKNLQEKGYTFLSETDTEVIVHLVHQYYQKNNNLLETIQEVVEKLEGAYGLAVVHRKEPEKLVVARSGSPLVIGLGIDENFIASDQLALRQVTDSFVYLEEGDIAEVSTNDYRIFNNKKPVQRAIKRMEGNAETAEKGEYRHFMLKEIYQQPQVVRNTLEGRIDPQELLDGYFTNSRIKPLDKIESIHIVACGTSFHAGMVAKYWIENYTDIICHVEVASEYRYRKVNVRPHTLLLTLSQSGETADTLAALRKARENNYAGTITICNVPESSLVRESDIALMTEAGPEIGVASTKAFTTQLTALLLLTLHLGRNNGLQQSRVEEIISDLKRLPLYIEQVLELDTVIEKTFEAFSDKHHALFLGRGIMYPIAMEGSLKLKEISYIHAEAYPAGELKHGPLALVDDDMPVVAVAPNDELLEKLKSNLQEVQARGGKLYVFADRNARFENSDGVTVIDLPHIPEVLAPIVYTIPLQLMSYHVALMKGTDVDQPRNLAKSVTVE